MMITYLHVIDVSLSTPWKPNIDTKNIQVWKMHLLSKMASFWVSIGGFGCAFSNSVPCGSKKISKDSDWYPEASSQFT